MDKARVHWRSELLAAGYTEYELRRALRNGELTRLRRGAYLEGPEPEDVAARHRLAVHAAFTELAEGAVASHGSAAVLHGLPTWSVPLSRVQVTRARTYGGRRERLVHVRVARVDPDEIEYVEGIPVTTVARTIVDLARALPFEPAVVIGDAALAGQLSDSDQLGDMLRRSARRPRCARARRAVAFLDERAESVGESRSRVAIARADLPIPELQWEVRNGRGVLVGRGDFGWPGRRVIGEFDGRVKYGRLLSPGQEPGEAVYREKLREDALRAEGIMVIRWTWQDLESFDPVAGRLHRALA
ncbi:MAG TPA: type IV toxin-antitoxin system AbiEi family antitoxin domain-containing protein [Pseudonocardia sp.]|jgi:hypothetical protein|uniref:type IV toxin-antitoxin system AbiEi family antitoxin domain-containing protein n=1 Tax=Pseudonocardia sp. TaxID=60912 RepID=UPI002EDB5927